MKVRCLLVCGALLSLPGSPALSQGTFWFQNYSTSIDAPVFDAQGVRLAGTNYAAELWGGTASDSLSPTVDLNSGQRVIRPFETGLGAGYFYSSASHTVWAVTGGAFAWVQVRAWDVGLGATYEEVVARSLGGYGESTLLYIRGGNPLGLPTLPAPLTGLQSFSLLPVVPEPSTWALLALGGTALWLALRRRS